jgi:predicted nucleotide-binding protein
MCGIPKARPTTEQPAPKQAYVSQSEIPKRGINDAIGLAKTLYESFNGDAAPHELANAAGYSPTSSTWQYVTGAAVAFGLTEGAYSAGVIRLSGLGRRIAAPQADGDDKKAIQEAVLRPRIMRDFFTKYNKGKFPTEHIGINVLVGLGATRDSAKGVYEMTQKAGALAGFVTETKTGLYVALPTPNSTAPAVQPSGETGQSEDAKDGELIEQQLPITQPPTLLNSKNTKVFITHGKNHSIVEQLKEILKFGKFAPVVAVEHETTSRPVPEKVLSYMRSCFASVIHVASEEEYLTRDGKPVQVINENVLIEIGASMALYGNNFVLLVKKGIRLPSNLQGLYRCEYDGDKLDYEATMKLLKAFNEFR